MTIFLTLMYVFVKANLLYNITAICEDVKGANRIKLATLTEVPLNIEVLGCYTISIVNFYLFDSTASLEATKRGTVFISHGTHSASFISSSL